MRWSVSVALPVLLLVAAAVAQEEPLVMPGLVGQDLWTASKLLRGMMLDVKYEQAAEVVDSVPEFCVTSQEPDSGTALADGQAVLLRFYCPGMLRYWDEWVVPLLGDLANNGRLYSVEKPPEPITVPGAGYPFELLRYGFSGDAAVEALVDFDGAVLAARVTESSGYREADSAACEAALQARFSEAQHHGQPVRVWYPIPYTWQFEDVSNVPGGPQPAGQGGEVEP